MKSVLIEMEKLKNPNSGLGQFCLHLGLQFQKLKSPHLQIDYYLPPSQQNIFGNKASTVKQSPVNKYFSFNGNRYQVWHCLHQNSHYLPSSKNTKLILTIHDLNFLEKYKGIKRAIKLGSLQKRVDRAHTLTVISHYTEKMVREYLDIGEKQIHVIPNGNALEPVSNPKKPDFIYFEDYIFTIGIISKKKNFHTLLPLLEKNPNLHLVIAGSHHNTYASELIQTATKMKLDNRLHLPGTVNNEQKNWLYQNCKAFVFPSLTEGFGLPVVEAMSLGRPVFLSNLTSLPEIGGPEAFYWSNFEPDSMNQVFQDGLKTFNAEQSTRSIAWTKQFTWEAAAKAYLKIYEQI